MAMNLVNKILEVSKSFIIVVIIQLLQHIINENINDNLKLLYIIKLTIGKKKKFRSLSNLPIMIAVHTFKNSNCNVVCEIFDFVKYIYIFWIY